MEHQARTKNILFPGSTDISVLGSTGSIGRQTLEVAEELGVRVRAITARSSVKTVEEQVRKFHPELAVLSDPAAAQDLAVRLRDTSVTVRGGEEAVCEAAVAGGTVIGAIVGIACLNPVTAAVREGKRIALANKETLVCAGEIVMDMASRYGAEIIPVDSEHSAIFQCMQGCADRGEVKRLILTCSGGPFFGMRPEELQGVTKADALKHPNWSMGEKITIDSATLMNKGLEVIGLPLEQVHVVIHRQSIVHSLVEFCDGAMLAQLGTPDMRLPIRYALTYPNRGKSSAPPLDLLSSPPLTFAEPDRKTFPCLALAEDAAREGGTACAILNGANEAAVELFLHNQAGFYDIPRLVELARRTVPAKQNPSLEDIKEADRQARECVKAGA